jgi:raffinose/stachyose/melibiose transport system permease protein
MGRSTAKRKVLHRLWDSPSSVNLMYIPALVLFAVFIFYPISQGIRISQ